MLKLLLLCVIMVTGGSAVTAELTPEQEMAGDLVEYLAAMEKLNEIQ